MIPLLIGFPLEKRVDMVRTLLWTVQHATADEVQEYRLESGEFLGPIGVLPPGVAGETILGELPGPIR